MKNLLNKKIAELFEKMDDKVLQAKLNAALEMLKNGDTEELAKKLNKIDKNELLTKINEFDEAKLQSLNINIDELKRNISEEDLSKLSSMIGNDGEEIIKKIKTLLNNR